MNNLLPISGVASGAAALWIGGARVRTQLYAAGLLRQRSLRASVISIGNLSWGGTGKTPFTIWLASRLQSAGLNVSILTRGYGRTSRERVKILPPSLSLDAARADGDEVQLYLRYLQVPIGIASSRYDAGSVLERTFPVDVHLLDDGFQHLALHRDLDLVLIDASNPWGARPGWPLLLREGFSSLRRAHAVLLTRCELLEKTKIEKLVSAIRSYNPEAACFLVRTKLTELLEYRGGTPLPLEQVSRRRVFAFCALGNPQSFFRTLSAAGINVVAKKAFSDHHKYNAREIDLLAKSAQRNRADCLITTEKDIVNLPANTALPVAFYWAAIEPAVENEDKLLDWILERLRVRADRHSKSRMQNPESGVIRESRLS